MAFSDKKSDSLRVQFTQILCPWANLGFVARLQSESLLGWILSPTCIDTALYKATLIEGKIPGNIWVKGWRGLPFIRHQVRPFGRGPTTPG